MVLISEMEDGSSVSMLLSGKKGVGSAGSSFLNITSTAKPLKYWQLRRQSELARKSTCSKCQIILISRISAAERRIYGYIPKLRSQTTDHWGRLRWAESSGRSGEI